MLAAVALSADPWKWHAHPEVWLLVAGIVALGVYAVRVIGPKVVPRGQRVISAKQRNLFFVAVLLLWIDADWPIHDIGENYLYSVHMVQHLLMSYVVPPLFLLAVPEWFARLALTGQGRPSKLLRSLARPVPAGLIFTLVVILQHWPAVVRVAVENGPFHYSMHLLLFFSALLMWVPIIGPLPEMRISPPAKMFYLFLQSIVPTVPAGWLTFAENPVYKVYNHPPRLWDISVLSDQQAAGAIMKVIGGFYLWVIIAVIFFRWAANEDRLDRKRDIERHRPVVRPASDAGVGPATLDAGADAGVLSGAALSGAEPLVDLSGELTFEQVAEQFERAGPAPRERTNPTRPSDPPRAEPS